MDGFVATVLICFLTTTFFFFDCVACPSDLANPENDRCEQVTASVGLFLDDEAPQAARQLYQATLDRAISQGRLQDALMEINPESPVRIITGTSNEVNGSHSTEPPERPSAGATAGIVIGALTVVGFMVAIFIVRKREVKPGFDELKADSSIPSDLEFELDSAAEQELHSAENQRTDEEAGTVQSCETVLGATKTEHELNYGGNPQSSSDEVWSNAGGSKDYIQALSEGGQGPGAGGRSRSSSISSFGQSGWPSNNTSSIDSDGVSAGELRPSTFGTRMVDLATASTELYGSESSFSSRQSSTEDTCDSSLKVLLDEQMAAELHGLIEGGDWEGVVRAASTFEVDGKSLHGSISHQDSQG